MKRYTYDNLERLTKVEQGTFAGGTYAYQPLSELVYDNLGRVTNKKHAAVAIPCSTTYAYDMQGRITDIVAGGTGGFAESISSMDAYGAKRPGYAVGGNITDASYAWFGAEPLKFHYTYDDLSRLDFATQQTGTTDYKEYMYSYDILGRFKNKREAAHTVADYNYYSGTTAGGVNHQGTSRLKRTSRNASVNKEYVYDWHGNLIADFTKNMTIEYDFRDMPVAFRFYSNLGLAGITHDIRGTYNGSNLYQYCAGKVADNTIALLSTVRMIYDADGNRVCKMEIRD